MPHATGVAGLQLAPAVGVAGMLVCTALARVEHDDRGVLGKGHPAMLERAAVERAAVARADSARADVARALAARAAVARADSLGATGENAGFPPTLSTCSRWVGSFR